MSKNAGRVVYFVGNSNSHKLASRFITRFHSGNGPSEKYQDKTKKHSVVSLLAKAGIEIFKSIDVSSRITLDEGGFLTVKSYKFQISMDKLYFCPIGRQVFIGHVIKDELVGELLIKLIGGEQLNFKVGK